jgi:hypothetical protein
MSAESSHDCLLCIAFPAELEEEMIDLLREYPEVVSGFTLLAAEGFGAGTRLGSAMEQVRGRARRRLLQLLLAADQATMLTDALRARLPSEEVAWWTSAVTGFGRFA